MKVICAIALLIASLLTVNAIAKDASIKLTDSGLCLTPEHKLYEEERKYIALYSLDECLNRGGRHPRSDKVERKIQQSMQIQNLVSPTTKQFSIYEWPHWLLSPDETLDVRNYFLKATSESPTTSLKSSGIVTGEWTCPFSNSKMYRTQELKLMHIVPLQYAHENGGSRWSRAQKELFANDFQNMIATHRPTAEARENLGLVWVPEHNLCWYFEKFHHIMQKYELTYPPNEGLIKDRLYSICSE